MISHPYVIVAVMTLFSFCGSIGFQRFSVTRDILWLVAGFCCYGLSNVAFILVIDQTGVARAMVIASAANILLTTTAGFYLGERVGVYGVAAALVACIAAGLTMLGDKAHGAAPLASAELQTDETGDV